MKKTFLAALLLAPAGAGLLTAQEAAKSPRVGVIEMARVSAESCSAN